MLYNEVAQTTRDFLSGRHDRVAILDYVKHHMRYGDAAALIRRISHNTSLAASMPEPFPKRYGQFFNSSRKPLAISRDWITEVAWHSHYLKQWSKQIQSFIHLRHKFGTALLLGDYRNAELIMNEINSKVCVSLWSLEKTFLLRQLHQGFSANKSARRRFALSDQAFRCLL